MRQTLVDLYRRLGALRLNTGSAGNVSARTDAGMLITPTGARAETLAAAAIVAMDLDGHAEAGRPSSEWAMHAAIYRAVPQAGVIVHTHADAATALACLREGLPAFHYMIAAFGGDDVRCAPYATFGTDRLAAHAAAAMAGRTACLLANHGMIACGRDAAAAEDAAVTLETLCRQYLLARSAGTVALLDAAQMQAARARFASYGAHQGS